LIDPARQYPELQTIHSLPAEWLNKTDLTSLATIPLA
jgi:hypothetical protein